MRERRFLTTHWSTVLAAGGTDSEPARAALTELCVAYWVPLYAFARRAGADEHDAADLTQDFFAALIENDVVAAADRERGRFRTFLIAAFRHHCSNARVRAAAQKRGGGRTRVPLDFGEGERRYRLEPVDDVTPERVFERRWALTVLARALAAVEADMRGRGKGPLYAALEPYLAAGTERPAYAETAARLGLSEGAVKSAIRRVRARYRNALRAEIAHTVPDEDAVDAEIEHLMAALST